MNTSDYNERLKTTGRNDPCPCNSGKKYKKCHLSEDEDTKHKELLKTAQEREALLTATEENHEKQSADTSSRNRKKKRDVHQNDAKSRTGKDTHANIPRRGAV